MLDYHPYIRAIVTPPQPVLRRRCLPLKKHELRLPLTQQVIDDMVATMEANNGIGLAANQIGWPKRIFVMAMGGLVAINPRIEVYGKAEESIEGCLSLPHGHRYRVLRHRGLFLAAHDRAWKPYILELRDEAAICVQHEIDHLDGKTIADRQVDDGLIPP